jgi:hypothetical protein
MFRTLKLIQQRKSQVLLLIEIDSEDTKSIIPGKLFEYMVSNRPKLLDLKIQTLLQL